MILVHVYVRHSAHCKHKKNADWKQCRCPKHLHWHHEGKLFRESARTRSWSNAQQKARAVELKFDHIDLGKAPQKHEPVTIEKAVTQYLADKKSQQLADPTLEKLETIFRKQMLLWCRENGVYFVVDFSLAKLQEFRSSWHGGALAARKKQERIRPLTTSQS